MWPYSTCSKWSINAGGVGGGGGVDSKKFCTGRLRPELLTLTILYIILPDIEPLLYTFQ